MYKRQSVCYAVGTLREGGFLTTDEKHYLHLTERGRDVDVYKRQLSYLVMQDTEYQLFASSVEEELSLGMKDDCKEKVDETMKALEPVSYTNIDVYKRQGRISRGTVLSDPAGVSARGGYGGRSKPYRL